MNFLVFSDDWGRHPSSCEHLFRNMSGDHGIIWVNTIGFRRPRLTGHDLLRSFEKVGSWFRRTPAGPDDLLGGRVTVISPPILPFYNAPVRRLNRRMVARAVRGAIARRGWTDYAVLSSLPNTGDFFEDHPGRFRVYYCVDDFTVMPGVDRDVVSRMEAHLGAQCDAILYTAENLRHKFERLGRQLLYLPHGVDYTHFSSAPAPVPIPDCPKPVIGFFGLISEWVDLDLVGHLARAHPEWTLLLIGKTSVSMDRLLEHRNVRWVGAVPYRELPAWASNFDVAMIPFEVDQLTLAVNPLKFLEYLAMGLPVVASPLPEIARFGDMALLASTPEEFVAGLERALREDSPELHRKRRECARGHSWAVRADQLVRLCQASGRPEQS